VEAQIQPAWVAIQLKNIAWMNACTNMASLPVIKISAAIHIEIQAVTDLDAVSISMQAYRISVPPHRMSVATGSHTTLQAAAFASSEVVRLPNTDRMAWIMEAVAPTNALPAAPVRMVDEVVLPASAGVDDPFRPVGSLKG